MNQTQMTTLPAIGSFRLVPFGCRAWQLAHVVGYSRDGGRIKVRAYNKSRKEWMTGTRLIDPACTKDGYGYSEFVKVAPPPAIR